VGRGRRRTPNVDRKPSRIFTLRTVLRGAAQRLRRWNFAASRGSVHGALAAGSRRQFSTKTSPKRSWEAIAHDRRRRERCDQCGATDALTPQVAAGLPVVPAPSVFWGGLLLPRLAAQQGQRASCRCPGRLAAAPGPACCCAGRPAAAPGRACCLCQFRPLSAACPPAHRVPRNEERRAIGIVDRHLRPAHVEADAEALI